ncbi:carboxypeptidase-like regulatory domain-containing protein [Marixanthomonas sp. SCSIO 43207]|uniref:carboxypeptidase-like regulatory domain-containing protein n=1 Tax=Marixanthomonas sp. SCSIO 43207 TaxID=2779360 RepID=UPI001CA85F0D|nr:carboxypeptidase-like regulatory domain-containing protein [Marixanthomonas sp. SCSIO 43207]UAB80786.1 carboxypeptidase-like regulatory domain-containing protein [Marixanthomonas sp. SCSIO 43207]
MFLNISYSQEELLPSITFNNSSLEEAILKIESQTDYQFFYVDSWINNQSVSGTYSNISIHELLDTLLTNSVLNYYITEDKRIILTQNSIVYNTLPEGFFPQEQDSTITVTTVKKEQYQPVFYNQETSKKSIPIETVRIGKESLTNTNNTYVLSGYVTNILTGRPIEDLAILVQGSNAGTTTNEEGFYSIKLKAGANVLETKLIGIEDVQKRVIIYNNGRLDIALNEDYELLGEVFLENEADKNIEETMTGSETIDVKVIKNIPLVLGERDILKVATTLPGISNTGEGAAGYNVRGGKADQNLILLDDAVIYNPSHFFGIFSSINPFTTGDVTIYKGSIPAEYGGRLSSVFDISTRDANVEEFGGEGSIGPVTANLTLETPIVKDKSAVMVGVRATYSDWILNSLDEESLQNSEASFYDGIIKFNQKIGERDEIKATGYYSKDRYSITSDSLFLYSNRLISAQWNHTFNENNKSNLLLANSEYAYDIEYDGATNDDFNLGYRINETQLKLKLTSKLNKKHTLDYGVSGKLYNVEPGELKPTQNSIVDPITIPKEKGLETAVFISDKFTVNDKLEFNAGIRYSQFAALGEASQRSYVAGLPISDATVTDTLNFNNNEVIETYGGPEARVSARYSFNPEFSIKASFNNTIQYIHTLSNNTTVSPTDTWKLSDLNIEPQRANQYGLGLYHNFDNNTYEVSLEGYYKRSKNILDFKTGSQLLLNENVETELLQGEGKAYGAELLLKKTKGKLNGWLGYSYSRSFLKLDSEFKEERINNGDYFPSNYDKPHDISVVANYKLTKRFSVSANFVYQTGRPITYPVGSYVINNSEFVLYSDRNEYRIPDYYRLDLSINFEGNHKLEKLAHSFWNISIYNVLGRNNPYSVFFVTKDGEVKAYQSSIFSIPVPTITYNFKF